MRDDRGRIEGAWRALSSATARRDAAAILDAAGPAMAVGLLQDCGTGMLVAIGESAHGLEEPAGRLAQALVERGWAGDAVLADLVSHNLATTPTCRLPLLVDVGELVDVVEGGSGGWLDLSTGIAWPQEIIDDGVLEDIPDPEQEPARWLEIEMPGSKDAWQDMADFAETSAAASASDELQRAIRGAGAFSRFQATLNRHPHLRVHWRVHSSERRTGRARAWLADAGYDALCPARPRP